MTTALPTVPGGFGAILADPPWRFQTWNQTSGTRGPDALAEYGTPRLYPTMTIGELHALPVGDSASRDTALFLWAIDSMLPEALDLGRSWGFVFKTVAFTWAKTRRHLPGCWSPLRENFGLGMGYWTRGNPEQCLLFTRGKPTRLAADVRQLIVAPRRQHSRKPDETHERIERLVGGPYLELFARPPHRPGWSVWGNEAVEAAA